jgi:O-methyltransferase/methyltransferase family protein
MTATPQARVADLIFGAWKGRILYAGVKLGFIDALSTGPGAAAALASELALDPSMTYRLLRAMASIGLLQERARNIFELTEDGRCLLADHPQSLRAVALLQEGSEHTAIWKHLPDIVREGLPHGFEREYGHSAFEHVDLDPVYAATFHAAMNDYSASQTKPVTEALKDYDLSQVRTVCDLGGGYGYLLCGILQAYPHLTGTVLERRGILANREVLEANRLGLAARCRYIEGDMFTEAPRADLYLLKLILHDWADPDAVRILASVRRAAPPGGRVFVIEHVVPGPETPHFAKLYDIHMMCWGPGRERTSDEYARLLKQAGWRYAGTRAVGSGMIALVEGTVS